MKTISINETQSNIINSFASANKYSRTKLESLVVDLFNTFPKSAHAGRKTSPETLETLKAIEAFSVTNTLPSFTLRDLATFTHSSPATVTNLMKKLEAEGKASKVGVVAKLPGVRGKAPALWAFKSNPNQEIE